MGFEESFQRRLSELLNKYKAKDLTPEVIEVIKFELESFVQNELGKYFAIDLVICNKNLQTVHMGLGEPAKCTCDEHVEDYGTA